MDRERMQHIILLAFIASLTTLCLIDRKIHIICVVCCHGSAGYYDSQGIWKGVAFAVIGAVCLVAGCFGKAKPKTAKTLWSPSKNRKVPQSKL